MTSTVQFRTPGEFRAGCVTLLQISPGAVRSEQAAQPPGKGEPIMS